MAHTQPGPRRSPRVLLAHMPMADPIMPNLGIELLAQRLRGSGISCDCFYGTLRLPPSCSTELMHGMAGYGLFSPAYFELDVDEWVEEAALVIARGSGDDAPYPASFANVASELHNGVTAAEICLERCLADIPVGAYDVIGFSIIFDTQKIPSVALAKALKAREPHLKILLGGTGCDGEMAEAQIEHFAEVDAVIRGDAEDMIAGFVRQLHGGIGPNDPIAANAAVRGLTAGRPPIDGRVPTLARRDRPDYAEFIAQWHRSPYRERPLTLLFEASRGCWWGEKHHCRFCGIRTVAEGYRQRDGDAVFDEIMALHQAYRAELLYATDAILSREHMRSLLPRLAAWRRDSGEPLRLFFEIKSTIQQQDAALMAAAGIVAVQPGIESFATNMLRQTDKGATGIRQIAGLKWLAAYGIDTIYGLLMGTPGETADDVRTLIRLADLLHHLQPPAGINPLALHRFSPYWREPERFGITGIRSYGAQQVAFRAPEPLMQRLCYELSFDSASRGDPELAMLYAELQQAVARWQVGFAQGAALNLVDTPQAPMIVRRRGECAEARLLDDAEHRLFRATAQPVSAARAASLAGLPLGQTTACLSALAEEGLVLAFDGLWLSLALPTGIDAFADAGLSGCVAPLSLPMEIANGVASAPAADSAGH